MKHWLISVAITIASWLLPNQSFAQGTDIGISGVGLLAIQPVDDTYVGSPYLNEGIGGLAPGFGGGLSVITPSGVVVAAEFSRALFELEQSGRLAAGEGRTATTIFHDSLLSGLVGYAAGGGTTRVLFLGGISAKLDSPTVDGEPRDGKFSLKEAGRPFAVTGGFDVLRAMNDRTALIITARYSYAARIEGQQYLGIGPHVLRLGAGLRLRLN